MREATQTEDTEWRSERDDGTAAADNAQREPGRAQVEGVCGCDTGLICHAGLAARRGFLQRRGGSEHRGGQATTQRQ